jgi:hypothetical protein
MGGTRRASGIRLLALACLVALSGTASAQTRLILLSPDEAVRLRLGREEPWGGGPTVRGSTGPRILVQEPIVRQTSNGPVIETPPSMSFFIVFEANGSPVDMESLEIKAKKGILSMSLTPRLKPYIEGTSLKVGSVTVPEGRFLIQIEILDKAGAKAVEQYRLEVRS